MSALIALSLLVCVGPAPESVLVPVESGRVTFYDSGVMQTVKKNRTDPDHPGYIPGLVVLPRAEPGKRRQPGEMDGYISRVDCGTIGRVFWLSVTGHKVRAYQQIDCSEFADAPRHKSSDLIAELDWESAVREGLTRLAPRDRRGVIWGWRGE